MSRMFKTITRTWNPFTGCRFDCSYCWARKLVEGRLQPQGKKYRHGFIPSFHPKELNRRFKPGEFVFVSDMGDIAFAPYKEQLAILERVYQFPDTRFLFQSKNPAILISLDYEAPTIYLGTTLETNRDYPFTKAPPPFQRYTAMRKLKHSHKFISLEPILDFDLPVLVRWLEQIQPEIVEVGVDNYRNRLSEPPWEKVEALLESLRKFVPRVVEKNSLERLRES